MKKERLVLYINFHYWTSTPMMCIYVNIYFHIIIQYVFKVKLEVYMAYLNAIGLLPGLSVIILAVLTKCLEVGSSAWLSKWSDDKSGMGNHTTPHNKTNFQN